MTKPSSSEAGTTCLLSPVRTPIRADVALRSLEVQGIDASGLDETDRKILRVLISRGRPIGLRSLADLVGESSRTLAEVYEPHLLREGFIARTLHGRVATEVARRTLFRTISGKGGEGGADAALAIDRR